MNAHEPPAWRPPGRYGQASAIDGMGAVAAPFLAGIAIALAVLVISSPENFGGENVALFALVLAAVALIACAECTFVARKYVVTPGQLEEWWPGASVEQLVHEQHEAADVFEVWADWSRRLYNVGIVALAAGVAAALVPPGGLGDAPPWRLAAFALALAAMVAELAAILITVTGDDERRNERRRMLEEQAAQPPNLQP
jgi:hypothetical protein